MYRRDAEGSISGANRFFRCLSALRLRVREDAREELWAGGETIWGAAMEEREGTGLEDGIRTD